MICSRWPEPEPGDYLPPEPPEELVCRCCAHVLHEFEIGDKPARVNGKIVWTAQFTMVECHTPGCDLWMQTLRKDSYGTLDLTAYLDERGGT